MKKHLVFLLTFFLLSALVITVYADDNFNYVGDADFARGLGTAAQILVFIGFAYSVLRRSYLTSKYLPADYATHVPKIGDQLPAQKVIQNFLRDTYKRFRRPVLILHYVVNAFATVLAIIHGYLFLNLQNIDDRQLTGIIAAAFMIIISFAGLLIWVRFRPIWNHREAKSVINFMHRQWVITIIFLIFFIIHTG